MKSQVATATDSASFCRDIETVAQIVQIGSFANLPRSQALPRLLPFLGEQSDLVADHALQAIKSMVPMAALEERWHDTRPIPEKQTEIPAWIYDSCKDWQGPDDIHSHLITCLATIDSETVRDNFLRRVAFLPGLRRSLPQRLKQQGLHDIAAQVEQLSHTHRRTQFPVQLGISPTMDCQLHCHYCISAGNHAGRKMTENEFGELVTWARNHDVRRIGFSGGEPTLYPNFQNLLQQVRDNDLEWYLASNGLIPPHLLDAIISYRPISVTLHLTPEILNSKLLASFQASARLLLSGGINTILRCNFFDEAMDISAYLDQAVACGIREVRAAVPMPNAYKQNSYITTAQLQGFAKILDQYVEGGKQRGLQVILAKPFPICLMSKQTAHHFLANDSLAANCSVHISGGLNNLVINPDLQPMPCLGVNTKADRKITEFTTLGAVGETFLPKLHDLIRTPLLASCHHCPLSIGARCIGGCLSYRIDSTGTI